jgi:hypothetical protein
MPAAAMLAGEGVCNTQWRMEMRPASVTASTIGSID